MKRILTGATLVGAAALGASFVGMAAQAADLSARAPYLKAPVAVIYDWTGFYVGVNAGIGVGRNRETHSFPLVTSNNTTFIQPQGGFGGGQIGYNWQTDSILGPLVLGVEADIQGAGLQDDRTTLFPGVQYSQKIDWFGTARGRIGLARGPVLGYVTGGFAYGDVKTSVNEAGLGAFSSNRTQGGWTLGSGVEAALGGNWTGKIEYLYVNLGNHTDSFAGTTQTLRSELRENIFRVGLNYRIGGMGYAPVMAANWTGLYVGGNFGAGTARNRSSLTAFGVTEQFNLAPDGALGGVQAGYNWQAANWVFGVEGDVQGSAQKDNDTVVLLSSVAYQSKLPWFATARGRLGYSVGSTLFYATGGYAYGNIKTSITTPLAVTSTSFNTSKGGWTAGAGIETPFSLFGLLGPNWTTKSEYLYVDLGSSSDTLLGAVSTTTRVQEHIFRSGLNYHFNSPLVARY